MAKRQWYNQITRCQYLYKLNKFDIHSVEEMSAFDFRFQKIHFRVNVGAEHLFRSVSIFKMGRA